MEIRTERQKNAVADEVSALVAVVRPILIGLLWALKHEVAAEVGGHDNVKLRMLARLRRPGYIKSHRRAQDWATVGVAAIANGGVRVAFTNMGATPLRASAVEQAIASGADPATAAASADEGTSPPSDTNGSAAYRRHLARVLTRRALEEVIAG